jgi:chromosome segregation ATPase
VPDSNDDIETRVTILEREVVQLRKQMALSSSDAAAARVLAAGADHDVSEVRAELRAHTQALNALRETQLELDQKVSGLDQKVTEGFALLGTGMAQITALLTQNMGSGQS